MVQLLTLPPPAEAIGAMVAIPGVQIAPTILATQSGPDGDRGPEDAGAVLMLQATFRTEDGAAAFWNAAVPLMALLAEAPGFIRRYSFPDGPAITLFALWRTIDDARAFAARPEHRVAVRDLYANGWQHTHFSAIWELATDHGRVVFCPGCNQASPVAAVACGACGRAVAD
jgi:heme-degrading monooxygenase HmoA